MWWAVWLEMLIGLVNLMFVLAATVHIQVCLLVVLVWCVGRQSALEYLWEQFRESYSQTDSYDLINSGYFNKIHNLIYYWICHITNGDKIKCHKCGRKYIMWNNSVWIKYINSTREIITFPIYSRALDHFLYNLLTTGRI